MRSVFITLILFVLPSTVIAQHSRFEDVNEYGFHGPHHLSVLTGDTYLAGEGDNFTVGIDYEYRVSKLLGLGTVIEKVYGDLDAITVLAVADLHLPLGLILQVGPGFERRHHEDVSVARVGMLYEIEILNFTVSPQLHWDYHDGEANAVVAGFAFGFAF